MKTNDQNDFFDDIIDDEAQANDEPADSTEFDAEEFDEDEEEGDEDEEDEITSMRTAILSKNEMLALLSMKTFKTGAQIVRTDPRQPLPTAQTYEDGAAATKWFRRSLGTSKKNGWVVIYDGEPIHG